ncbi:MAG: DUF1273 family protein [Clostridia bacterium]|nr:DUF1273 family protein [Clostridia bacterium]
MTEEKSIRSPEGAADGAGKQDEERAPRGSCCLFTGHRDLPSGQTGRISARTGAAIRAAYDAGARTFFAGGAVGFDMLASVAFLNMKAELPGARLVLVLPYFRHYAGWKRSEQLVFAEVLKRADEAVYLERAYVQGCFQQRNRYMVDRSGRCICYCRKASGGTAYTVKEAEKQGLTVVNVAEEEN